MFKISINRHLLEQRKLQEDMNELVRALKADDAEAAKKALVGMDPRKWGIAPDDFKKIINNIHNANVMVGKDKESRMDAARKILGITKGTPDPSLGKPASLTPAQIHGKPQHTQKTQATSTTRGKKYNINLTPQEQHIVQQLTGHDNVDDMEPHELTYLYADLEEQYYNIDNNPIYKSIMKKIKKHFSP